MRVAIGILVQTTVIDRVEAHGMAHTRFSDRNVLQTMDLQYPDYAECRLGERTAAHVTVAYKDVDEKKRSRTDHGV